MSNPFTNPRHRQHDKATSVAAADAVTSDPKRLTELQQLVLDFFRTHGNATDEELEDALMPRVPAASTLRKRRGDLVQLDILRDSGQTRRNRNNRVMVVWELVPPADIPGWCPAILEDWAEARRKARAWQDR